MRRRYRRRMRKRNSGTTLQMAGIVLGLAILIGAGLFVGVKGIRYARNNLGSGITSGLGIFASSDQKAALEEAEKLATMYDYDGAIEVLKELPDYASSSTLQDKAEEYRQLKSECVSYPLDKVTHIFFHTLIKDTSKCFDGDYKQDDYNQVMTTIDEFNKIMESMYEKGYVLVSLRDMAEIETDENGNEVMKKKEILLPEGKKAFVLSQDDVSYYEYMEGDGFATRLLIDEETGKIKNEYKNDDGTVSIGDYDVLPLLDSFIEEHPDFSYHGAKGILALTGYNGVLGYRTDPDYENTPEKTYFGDYNKDVEMAKEVAQAIRDDGWEFASHSYGHIDLGNVSWEAFQRDTDKWEQTVEPIIGETDIMIYPFGAEIGDWHEYSGSRYEYLKSVGFDYFCNVDSNQYWVQITDNYLRQGRRNLDGYRMYYNPEKLEDLFDAKSVFDPARPTPVRPMS